MMYCVGVEKHGDLVYLPGRVHGSILEAQEYLDVCD